MPFRSMVSASQNEPLGLPPAKQIGAEPTVKKRGPSAALRRHVRWLKELQEQMRGERELVEQEETEVVEKQKRITNAIAKHREAVRDMMEARDAGVEHGGSAPVPKQPERKSQKAPAAKPLWAMTEKEKDHFEEEEADDLINFAEGLNYEKYINDLDFRQGMSALQDRAGKLQKMQDAFKDELVRDFNMKVDDDVDRSTSAGGSPRGLNMEDGLDGQSILGDQRSEYSVGSRRSAGQERYGERGLDWDNSTNAGDDRPQVSREIRDTADYVLECNSNLRGIHSKASMQKVIAKNTIKEEEPVDLLETMRRDGPIQAPVITAAEDTQQRLHKPADPSQLPYLYRSPAV